MFNTTDEVLTRLAAGEDGRSEFKEVHFSDHRVRSPKNDAIAGEMVAFANAEGGVIFLGVTDDGIVQGIPIEKVDDTELWILNVARDSCEPPIKPLIRKEMIPRPDGSDTIVILIEIRRGIYVHRTSSGRYYVRIGSSKRDLSIVELPRLIQERGRLFIFDEQPVSTATVDDLDLTLLEDRYGQDYEIPRNDLLRNTRVVVTESDGVDRPTVGGLLAFGRFPSTHLRPAMISVAVYADTELDSDDLVDADQIGGHVGSQIDESIAFVKRYMKKPARKDIGRLDYPQYDLGAVYEAIINAVAHRDYSIIGSKIRLFLFSDRLEIYSPGALPNTLTIESMPYRVYTRNQLLVSFLSRLRSKKTGMVYLESRGEGVRKILRTSEAHSGRIPRYELFGEELRLTIWAKPPPRKE